MIRWRGMSNNADRGKTAGTPRKAVKESPRAQRLAAALRRNLLKRKAQSRARNAVAGDTGEPRK